VKAQLKLACPAKGLNVRQQTAPLHFAPDHSSDVPAVRAPTPDDDSISSGGIRLPQSNVGITSETTKNKWIN
jgi:hypothetical protein